MLSPGICFGWSMYLAFVDLRFSLLFPSAIILSPEVLPRPLAGWVQARRSLLLPALRLVGLIRRVCRLLHECYLFILGIESLDPR